MERNNYTKTPSKLIPKEFMHYYKLHNKIHDEHIYLKIKK